MSDWMTLLSSAVASHPRGITGVSETLGLKNHSAISQVLSGSYGASTDNIARRVLDHYDRPDCPLVAHVIARALCRKTALREQPIGGDALVRWMTCQTCPNKPKE
jgi:hypothetical protein